MSEAGTVHEAVPSVQISAEVTRQIRQHARTSMNTEVCGVLVGDLRAGGGENTIDITAAIPAVNAAQAGTHVTFTQDAWEHIYKVKDAEYPEARIVGWYHSHPGFGVFLSEHDTFIQDNFFSAADQVAWVYDPHTDEEGCFGWVGGKITRLESITIADSGAPGVVSESRELAARNEAEVAEAVSGPEKERAAGAGAGSRWLRWTATLAMLMVALVVGFFVSRIFFPVPFPYPLVLPINMSTGQPMLIEPKSGEPVYMDPQTKKYVIAEKSGKLTEVDLKQLKRAQLPPEDGNPFAQAPGAQGAPEAPQPAAGAGEKK